MTMRISKGESQGRRIVLARVDGGGVGRLQQKLVTILKTCNKIVMGWPELLL